VNPTDSSSRSQTLRESAACERVLVLLLALATAARVAFSFDAPLWEEEAFLWMQGRRLDLCYYHNPPLVSWLIGLSARALGDSALAVRLPAIALSTLSIVAAYALARALFGSARIALAAAGILLVMPIANAFAFIVFHQSALLAFYPLALLALVRAREAGGRRIGPWIALGLAAGLAALSQYIAILLLPTALLVLLADATGRRALRGPGPYAAFAVAAAVASPVFVWGARHDWENFLWHLGVRFDFEMSRPAAPLEYVGLQALAVSPLLYVALLAALVAAARRLRDPAFRFVAIAGGVPVLFFAALTPFAFVFAYYAGVGFAPLAIGLAALAAERSGRLWRRAAAAGAAIAAVSTVAMVSGAAVHRVADYFFPGIEDHFARQLAGERALAERAAAARGREPFLLGAKDYDTAALAWFTRLPDDTFCVEHRPGLWQYHVWRPADGGASLLGRDAILVAPRIRRRLQEKLLRAFDSVEMLEPIRYGRGHAHRYEVARCSRFRGFGDRPDCPFSHDDTWVPVGER